MSCKPDPARPPAPTNAWAWGQNGLPKVGGRWVGIDHPLSRRIADLSLHREDLQFAKSCVVALKGMPEDDKNHVREAVWRSAVVHFFKCFGDNKSRFNLSGDGVFKAAPPGAKDSFEYFLDLRNKHFVHDENTLSQAMVGIAVLEGRGQPVVVEKITCMTARYPTLDGRFLETFAALVAYADHWVTQQFEMTEKALKAVVEKMPSEEVLALQEPHAPLPTLADVKTPRKPPQP